MSLVPDYPNFLVPAVVFIALGGPGTCYAAFTFANLFVKSDFIVTMISGIYGLATYFKLLFLK